MAKVKCNHRWVGNDKDRMMCWWCGMDVPLNSHRTEWNEEAAYAELATMLKRDGVISGN